MRLLIHCLQRGRTETVQPRRIVGVHVLEPALGDTEPAVFGHFVVVCNVPCEMRVQKRNDSTGKCVIVICTE